MAARHPPSCISSLPSGADALDRVILLGGSLFLRIDDRRDGRELVRRLSTTITRSAAWTADRDASRHDQQAQGQP